MEKSEIERALRSSTLTPVEKAALAGWDGGVWERYTKPDATCGGRPWSEVWVRKVACTLPYLHCGPCQP